MTALSLPETMIATAFASPPSSPATCVAGLGKSAAANAANEPIPERTVADKRAIPHGHFVSRTVTASQGICGGAAQKARARAAKTRAGGSDAAMASNIETASSKRAAR